MAATSRIVPVACDDCAADMRLTVTTEGDHRVVVFDCPACGAVGDVQAQKLESVRAFVAEPGRCGPAEVGKIWAQV